MSFEEKMNALKAHNEYLKKYRQEPSEENWKRVITAWDKYLAMDLQYEALVCEHCQGTGTTMVVREEEGAPEDGGPENG